MIYIHDYTAQVELSSTALELGGNLQEGKMVDLEYVLPYLPELDDYEYTDYVWVFKTIGNIEPHVDEDYGTHSLFILLDKFCLSYLDNNFLFIEKNEYKEMRPFECVIFNHRKNHGVITNSAWLGLSVVLKKKRKQK